MVHVHHTGYIILGSSARYSRAEAIISMLGRIIFLHPFVVVRISTGSFW